MGYKLSEPAKNDLKEIWNYIAEYNSDFANKKLKEFKKEFDLIATNPKIGRNHDNFIINLRSFPFKKYIIFYFIIENDVEIYRVLHGARDIEKLFEDYFKGLKP